MASLDSSMICLFGGIPFIGGSRHVWAEHSCNYDLHFVVESSNGGAKAITPRPAAKKLPLFWFTARTPRLDKSTIKRETKCQRSHNRFFCARRKIFLANERERAIPPGGYEMIPNHSNDDILSPSLYFSEDLQWNVTINWMFLKLLR